MSARQRTTLNLYFMGSMLRIQNRPFGIAENMFHDNYFYLYSCAWEGFPLILANLVDKH